MARKFGLQPANFVAFYHKNTLKQKSVQYYYQQNTLIVFVNMLIHTVNTFQKL